MTKNCQLSSFIPQEAISLTKFKGKDLIKIVGEDIFKNVVYSILCGGNVRTLTEGLTQKRLIVSNASLFITYLKGLKNIEGFVENLPQIIKNEVKQNKLTVAEKTFLQWMIGITGKGFQNVSRGDEKELDSYLSQYSSKIFELSLKLSEDFGELKSKIEINQEEFKLSWPSFLQLFYGIGTQTLGIRGSEKSMYGKLFEKLILGSLLEILDFKKIDPNNDTTEINKVFWLSERKNKRESDATIIVKPGFGARFDLGFIGPGNSEISLDKVSRFEKEMEHGRSLHYMSTIIIVDRIGSGSRIAELARQINGSIVQMSMTYWVFEIAELLKEKLGYNHEILKLSKEKSLDYINRKMQKIDLSKYQ